MANVDAYVDLGTPPWFEPTEDRVAAARIEHFRNWARGQGFPAQDFSALWQWSVDQPESFWSALWEYFELPATTGPALADAPRPVRPGIRWFPEVRLNYSASSPWAAEQAVALVNSGRYQIHLKAVSLADGDNRSLPL